MVGPVLSIITLQQQPTAHPTFSFLFRNIKQVKKSKVLLLKFANDKCKRRK
jgi:hypothetical protein